MQKKRSDLKITSYNPQWPHVPMHYYQRPCKPLRQWFSTLAAHLYFLENFKECWCLAPTQGVRHHLSGVCPEHQNFFKSFSGDTKARSRKRTTAWGERLMGKLKWKDQADDTWTPWSSLSLEVGQPSTVCPLVGCKKQHTALPIKSSC